MSCTYSAIRKVNRNKVRNEVKKYNSGIPKRDRIEMNSVWNEFQEQRYGKNKYNSILKKNKKKKNIKR